MAIDITNLHCPKCAGLLEDIEGELACMNTKASLSRVASSKLREWASAPPEQKRLPYQIGGEWFCPACGSSCSETEPGLLVCSSCERSLAPLIRGFVEQFAHPR